jgi:hypothetical protein
VSALRLVPDLLFCILYNQLLYYWSPCDVVFLISERYGVEASVGVSVHV